MASDINWCDYFRYIEEDPTAITPRITVRQYLQAKNHLSGCDVCYNRTERVLAKAPKQIFPKPEKN